MKKVPVLILLLLFVQPAFSRPADVAHLFVKMSRLSPVGWGQLYINGRSYGVIRRGQTREYTVRANRTYRITIQRRYAGALYIQTKTDWLRPGQNRYFVIKPVSRTSGGQAYIRIFLSGNSRVTYAYIKINNRLYGMIRRGESRRFSVTPGYRYRVYISRVWRGRTYWRDRYVRVPSGRTQNVVFRLDD